MGPQPALLVAMMMVLALTTSIPHKGTPLTAHPLPFRDTRDLVGFSEDTLTVTTRASHLMLVTSLLYATNTALVYKRKQHAETELTTLKKVKAKMFENRHSTCVSLRQIRFQVRMFQQIAEVYAMTESRHFNASSLMQIHDATNRVLDEAMTSTCFGRSTSHFEAQLDGLTGKVNEMVKQFQEQLIENESKTAMFIKQVVSTDGPSDLHHYAHHYADKLNEYADRGTALLGDEEDLEGLMQLIKEENWKALEEKQMGWLLDQAGAADPKAAAINAVALAISQASSKGGSGVSAKDAFDATATVMKAAFEIEGYTKGLQFLGQVSSITTLATAMEAVAETAFGMAADRVEFEGMSKYADALGRFVSRETEFKTCSLANTALKLTEAQHALMKKQTKLLERQSSSDLSGGSQDMVDLANHLLEGLTESCLKNDAQLCYHSLNKPLVQDFVKHILSFADGGSEFFPRLEALVTSGPITDLAVSSTPLEEVILDAVGFRRVTSELPHVSVWSCRACGRGVVTKIAHARDVSSIAHDRDSRKDATMLPLSTDSDDYLLFWREEQPHDRKVVYDIKMEKLMQDRAQTTGEDLTKLVWGVTSNRKLAWANYEQFMLTRYSNPSREHKYERLPYLAPPSTQSVQSQLIVWTLFERYEEGAPARSYNFVRKGPITMVRWLEGSCDDNSLLQEGWQRELALSDPATGVRKEVWVLHSDRYSDSVETQKLPGQFCKDYPWGIKPWLKNLKHQHTLPDGYATRIVDIKFVPIGEAEHRDEFMAPWQKLGVYDYVDHQVNVYVVVGETEQQKEENEERLNVTAMVDATERSYQEWRASAEKILDSCKFRTKEQVNSDPLPSESEDWFGMWVQPGPGFCKVAEFQRLTGMAFEVRTVEVRGGRKYAELSVNGKPDEEAVKRNLRLKTHNTFFLDMHTLHPQGESNVKCENTEEAFDNGTMCTQPLPDGIPAKFIRDCYHYRAMFAVYWRGDGRECSFGRTVGLTEAGKVVEECDESARLHVGPVYLIEVARNYDNAKHMSNVERAARSNWMPLSEAVDGPTHVRVWANVQDYLPQGG